NLAKEFLVKAKEIGLRAYGEALKGKTKQLEENRANESEYYSEQAVESRKIAMLRFFDNHVDIVNDAINKSLEKNVSMEEVKTALAEFVSLKPKLVSAINTRNKEEINSVNKQIKDAWKKIRDAFLNAHLGNKIQRSIDRGNSIAKEAESNIRKIKSSGIQAGAIEKRLSEYKNFLSNAQTSADSGDYVAAQDAIRSARTTLNELKSTHDKAIEEKSK
ncbi:MAG: hypothetical protein AABX51_07515, partial [Nanoarchaeota archaeon]